MTSEPNQIDPSDGTNRALNDVRKPETAAPPPLENIEVAEWAVEADAASPQPLPIAGRLGELELLQEEHAGPTRNAMPSIRGRIDVAQSPNAKNHSAREATRLVEEDSRQGGLVQRLAEPHLVQRAEASARQPTASATHVLENPLQTVVIREEQSPGDSSIRLDPGVNPPMVSIGEQGPNEANGREFKAAPVTVYTQIAPLTDFGLEKSPLGQTPAPSQPTIHVTIGRVEVRAVQQAQSPTKNRASQPLMTLDDYLRRRSQGSGQ
jgi:hypothetical protein